jgi:hypothetical protein
MSVFLSILLMAIVFAPMTAYGEVPSGWAASEVEQALIEDLIPDSLYLGYKDNTTRMEFCHLVMKMIQVKTGMTISEFLEVKGAVVEPLNFTDTDDPLILAANALGIVDGVGNNKFNPNGLLQRQQAAAMLARSSKVLGYDTPSDLPVVFSDSSTFQVYAVEPIAFVSAAKDRTSGRNVMGGMGNNMFGPAAPYTKEQAILTMLRLFNSFDYDSVPRVLGIDSIEGTPTQGHKLTAGVVAYDSVPTENPVLSWQWVSSSTENGTYSNIAGATSRNYTPDAGDVGKYINVIVTAEGGARGSGLSFPVLIERFQLILVPIKPIGGFYPIEFDNPFDGGKGTMQEPFLISTIDQIELLKSNTADTYFKLTNDINLGNLSERITNPFLGHLDGDGHKVTFSYMAGLFKQIGEGATVKNLIVAGGITGEGPNSLPIGRLADTNYGDIERCGSDTSSMLLKNAVNVRVGGLVGRNYGTISESYSSGIIKVQLVAREAVNGSYPSLADGILGNDWNKGLVGGLVGVNTEGGLIQNCWSITTVIVDAPGELTYGIAGGLVGSNLGTVEKCYTVGSVTKNKYKGAISGYRVTGSVSDDCYYDMDTFRLSDTYAGQPKTTLQMLQRATYIGWDENIWSFNSTTIDYPRLSWQR